MVRPGKDGGSVWAPADRKICLLLIQQALQSHLLFICFIAILEMWSGPADLQSSVRFWSTWSFPVDPTAPYSAEPWWGLLPPECRQGSTQALCFCCFSLSKCLTNAEQLGTASLSSGNIHIFCIFSFNSDFFPEPVNPFLLDLNLKKAKTCGNKVQPSHSRKIPSLQNMNFPL